MSLSCFPPAITTWFAETLGSPTPVQEKGWAAIATGRHSLIAAPTGSGKTLAAFLTALASLVDEARRGTLTDETRVLYVSPLKALSADIHRNLAEPRQGIRRAAAARGDELPRLTAAVRTGDTTAAERAAMLRQPPHILITTPESLYLLLTAERSRALLRTVRTVIVDEIHAVVGSRRGPHLALSLERLARVTERPPQRIGLSATQRPIEAIAAFLTGAAGGDCAIVDEGHRRALDLGVELPGSPLEAVMAQEVWEEYYDRLAALIAEHRTTLVFVNTRRLAERVTRHLADRLGEEAVTAHHGSLSKDRRLRAEERLKAGALRALVATSSLELGIDVGHVDLACQLGSPHLISTFLQRIGRSGHTVRGLPKGRLFPLTRDDLVECVAILRSVAGGVLDALRPVEKPLDVLAQQIVAEASCGSVAEDELFALVRRAWPYRDLTRAEFDEVVHVLAAGFATRRGRRAALVHRDGVRGHVRARRGARLLAVTSGGAIPEIADYRVLLDPDDTFIGTLNEDFAIESMVGDVFQLGNSSWRVLRVGSGVVRVADAHGAPPNIPFWLGEAPARSDELSEAVADLRVGVERALTDAIAPPEVAGDAAASLVLATGGAGPQGDDPVAMSRRSGAAVEAAVAWITTDAPGVSRAAAEQVVAYLADARRALGALPTRDTIVLERFFDDSGGMQLVLHAPFGSRVNRAWGLALRKRFCRQFNFELQAAATEEGVLLSLGPQHSFPLVDVFRYLHPDRVKDILVQALIDAPMFATRWRWNTTVALAVPRSRGGRKLPAQLQRMLADDLMTAVFPEAAACLENIPGDREVPDHPLVRQTIRDCLEEAMDLEALEAVLRRIWTGEITCIARETPEPSVLSHELLNARPYAFLDDAPLEERRAHAVYTRRATEVSSAADLGALDPAAIDRVRAEAWPDLRDADDLHDLLLTIGVLVESESAAPDRAAWKRLFDRLRAEDRACRVAWTSPQGDSHVFWVAAERVPELSAIAAAEGGRVGVEPLVRTRPATDVSAAAALRELVRGRMTVAGPIHPSQLARMLGVAHGVIEEALLELEHEGSVLRGRFTPAATALPADEHEWCDRALLARIHRYTITRLRAEIEPVTPADFMRFLFSWHHVDGATVLAGVDGLRETILRLEGVDAAAKAWERSILPARVADFDPATLDLLCLSGELTWARLSPPPAPRTARVSSPVASTPVAFLGRERAGAWLALAPPPSSDPSPDAAVTLERLQTRGALFLPELASATGLPHDRLERALGELVAAGRLTSDSFAGLRGLLVPPNKRRLFALLSRRGRRHAAGLEMAGRWSALTRDPAVTVGDRDAAVEVQARALLRRYGVVSRRVLLREPPGAPWRDLVRVYRRLEARGEIRGGRFITGLAGEQFALPEAVVELRRVRREGPRNNRVVLSAADPLNLTGVFDASARVPALQTNSVVYLDGVPVTPREAGRRAREQEFATTSQLSAAGEMLASSGR